MRLSEVVNTTESQTFTPGLLHHLVSTTKVLIVALSGTCYWWWIQEATQSFKSHNNLETIGGVGKSWEVTKGREPKSRKNLCVGVVQRGTLVHLTSKGWRIRPFHPKPWRLRTTEMGKFTRFFAPKECECADLPVLSVFTSPQLTVGQLGRYVRLWRWLLL